MNPPPNTEELIRAVPEDDIEMICRGLITRHEAAARGWCVEKVSRLEHELLEVSSSLKQVVNANTTY